MNVSSTTERTLSRLLQQFLRLFLISELPTLRKAAGCTVEIKSAHHKCPVFSFYKICLFINVLSCLAPDLVEKSVENCLAISELNISNDYTSRSLYDADALNFSSPSIRDYVVVLWTSIITALPQPSDLRLRLSTLLGKALLNVPINLLHIPIAINSISMVGTLSTWYFSTLYQSASICRNLPANLRPSNLEVDLSETLNDRGFLTVVEPLRKTTEWDKESRLSHFANVLTGSPNTFSQIRNRVPNDQGSKNSRRFLPAALRRNLLKTFWRVLSKAFEMASEFERMDIQCIVNSIGTNDRSESKDQSEAQSRYYNILSLSGDISSVVLHLFDDKELGRSSRKGVPEAGGYIAWNSRIQTPLLAIQYLVLLFLKELRRELGRVPNNGSNNSADISTKNLLQPSSVLLHALIKIIGLIANSGKRSLRTLIQDSFTIDLHDADNECCQIIHNNAFHSHRSGDNNSRLSNENYDLIDIIMDKAYVPLIPKAGPCLVSSVPTSPQHQIRCPTEICSIDDDDNSWDGSHSDPSSSKRRRVCDTSISIHTQQHEMNSVYQRTQRRTLWDFGEPDENRRPSEEISEERESLWDMPERTDRKRSRVSNNANISQAVGQHQMLSPAGQPLGQNSSGPNISCETDLPSSEIDPTDEQTQQVYHPRDLISAIVQLDIIISGDLTKRLIQRALGSRSYQVILLTILSILDVLRSICINRVILEDRNILHSMCSLNYQVKCALGAFANCPEGELQRIWPTIEIVLREWVDVMDLLIEAALESREQEVIILAIKAAVDKLDGRVLSDDCDLKNSSAVVDVRDFIRRCFDIGIQTFGTPFWMLKLVTKISEWKSKVKTWTETSGTLPVGFLDLLENSDETVSQLESIVRCYMSSFDRDQIIPCVSQFELPLLLGSNCVSTALQAFHQDDLLDDFRKFGILLRHGIRKILRNIKSSNTSNVEQMNSAWDTLFYISPSEDKSPKIDFIITHAVAAEEHPVTTLQDDSHSISSLYPIRPSETLTQTEVKVLWESIWVPLLLLPSFQNLIVLVTSFPSFQPLIISQLLSLYSLLDKAEQSETFDCDRTSHVWQSSENIKGRSDNKSHYVERVSSSVEAWKWLVVYFLEILVQRESGGICWVKFCLDGIRRSFEVPSIVDNHYSNHCSDHYSGYDDMKLFDILALWSSSVFDPSGSFVQLHGEFERPFFIPLTRFWNRHYDLFGCLGAMSSGENVLDVIQNLANLMKREVCAKLTLSLAHAIVTGLVLKELQPPSTSTSTSSSSPSLSNDGTQVDTFLAQKQVLKQLVDNPESIILCIFRLFLFDLLPTNMPLLEQTLDRVIFRIFSPNSRAGATLSDQQIVNEVEIILGHVLTPGRLGYLLCQSECFVSSEYTNDECQQDLLLSWLFLRLSPSYPQNDEIINPQIDGIKNNGLNTRVSTVRRNIAIEISLFQILFHHSISLLARRLSDSSPLIVLSNAIRTSISSISTPAFKCLFTRQRGVPQPNRSLYWSLGEAMGQVLSVAETSDPMLSSRTAAEVYKILTSPFLSIPSDPTMFSGTVKTGRLDQQIPECLIHCDTLIKILTELIKRQLQLESKKQVLIYNWIFDI